MIISPSSIMFLGTNVRMCESVPLYVCAVDCSHRWALHLWLFCG